MLYIKNSGSIIPTDDYCINHKANGLDELRFSVPVESAFYKEILEETKVVETTEGIEYLVKAIDGGGETADYICQINLNDLKSRILGTWSESGHAAWNSEGQQTLATMLNWCCVNGWTSAGELDRADKKYIALDGPTHLELLLELEDQFGVCLRFDNGKKTITAVYPEDKPLSNSYILRSVNAREINYTGKSSEFATRLYPEGKDGLTVYSVNGNVPYVENTAWCDDVVAAYWKDERYTDAESLLKDATTMLGKMAMPDRSWKCDVVDLNRIDPVRWPDMGLEIFKKVHVIDDNKGVGFDAYICEDDVYPYHPDRNAVIISTVPGSVQSVTNKLRKAVENRNSKFWQQLSAARNSDDLISHTSNTDIHVTAANKSAWNGKYTKPSGGIPASDMASAVQTAITKATAMVDYLIERGTSGIWTYEKYASGALRVWGVYEYTALACNTAYGSGGWYRTGDITPPAYPVAFVETPVVSMEWRPPTSSLTAVLLRSTVGSASHPPKVQLTRPSTSTSLGGAIEIMAVGKWK